MGKLHLNYDITGLVGADYNPRRISEEDIEMLAKSIARLDLVKPLIVRGNLLVAGHQRTKALRRLGRTTGAVYLLSTDTTKYDEVRFNQLHNGTDLDSGDENCNLATTLKLGYQVVDPSCISANMRCRLAPVRAEICKLIGKYGPWGGVVATDKGEVIHAAQYALAAKLTGTPLTVYVVAAARKEEYTSFLNREYGQFSYEALERNTYIQSFAQMFRLRDGPSGKSIKSRLYENLVIPWINENPGLRGIDFGSGQGDYAKMLRRRGVNLLDVELFRRKGGSAFNFTAINRMIDKMNAALVDEGKFDFVICDSVLNSVDCKAAETSVMTWLNYLCKPGGKIFFSGRSVERIHSNLDATKTTDTTRYIEFLDDEGYSSLYRKGRWFFQKFHSVEQVDSLAFEFKMQILDRLHNKHSTSWRCMTQKVGEMSLEQVIAAAEYEFNLPISDDRTIDRHEDVVEVIKKVGGLVSAKS